MADVSAAAGRGSSTVWCALRGDLRHAELALATVGEQAAAHLRAMLVASERVVGGISEADRRKIHEVADIVGLFRKTAIATAERRVSPWARRASQKRRAAWLAVADAAGDCEKYFRAVAEDPMLLAMGSAADDDEDLSLAEIDALDKARAEMDERAVVSTSDLRRRLRMDA